ncbi:unnamed protein product [Orchesella dallaii]|uniref:Uncharacterized protein n=1 Tax=Orchesella dallaii TaxID=48710 RepID=A0ABP1R5D6_9HEXA
MAPTKRVARIQYKKVKALVRGRLSEHEEYMKERAKIWKTIQRTFKATSHHLDWAAYIIRNLMPSNLVAEGEEELKMIDNRLKEIEEMTRAYLKVEEAFNLKIRVGLHTLNCSRPSMRYYPITLLRLTLKLLRLV